MRDPVLVTGRPTILGGIVGRLVHPLDLTGTDWRDADLLLVDVAGLDLLEATHGRRDAVTLLLGYGDADERASAALFAAERCAGYFRVDSFDSRTALRLITGRYRSPDRARLLETLGGH